MIKNANGTINGAIATLHAGGKAGGYGYITPDAHAKPWKLIFRQADVSDNGFALLFAGQRVCFDQEPVPGNPSRQHAVRVAPLD